MTQFLNYAIPGLPYGCIYALVAIGLVLIYKTSGVFNLGFGAQAYVSAIVFYWLAVEHGWSVGPAFVVAGIIVGGGLGFVLDRLLFRHLRTASLAVKLISALGLLVALPEATLFIFGNHVRYRPPSTGFAETRVFRWGNYHLNGFEATATFATVAIAIGLALLFNYTAIGLKMRAVVESPRMVELAGVNANRVSLIAWVLSSVLAGIAGILLAPFYPQVDVGNFTVLLVAAIAAACFGRLSSLPMTLVGGLVLGVGSNLLAGYLPTDTPTWAVITNNLRPSFPFVLLLGLLLFLPGLRQRREATDPLAACDPPPPALAATVRDASLDRVSKIAFPVFVAGFLAITFFVLSDLWRYRFTAGLIFTTIFLSITVLTGLAGQISLCQATFAAVGAFTVGQMQLRYGTDFFTALIVAAVLSALVGAIVAIPALRLGGLFLTLATIAFALMAEGVIFPLDWAGKGTQGLQITRPTLGPVDFANDRWYFLLSFVVFAICGALVILVRKGTTGRFLAAMRGSEVAAASVGINPVRWKILVFALSAAIAGVGGAMYGGLLQQTSTSDFGFFLSFVWVVLVLTLGSRTVEGAVNAGMAFMLAPIVLGWVGDWTHFGDRITVLQYVLFGYGAITYARHPEGIIEHQKRKSMERIQRLRSGGKAAPPPDGGADDERAGEPDLAPTGGPARIGESTVR